MPASAQDLRFIETYLWEAGSSPTRTVARPGTTPCARSFVAASLTSARMSAAIALPSMMRAVMVLLQSCAESGVEETGGRLRS